MNSVQVFLLSWQVLLTGLMLAFVGYHLWICRQERQKYKLYAVRDRLIYLAATDTLPQDKFLFKVLYNVINRSIAEIQDLTLWSFIKASRTARTTLQEANMERLLSEIANASPEVQAMVFDFFEAMMQIVAANSPFLALCVRGIERVKSHQLSSMFRAIWEKLMPKERYINYRFFEGLMGHDPGHQHA